MTDLAGRKALVTGASRNLGAEIAARLAAAGATVAVNHRASADAAASVVAELTGEGHVVVAGDVSDPTAAETVTGEAVEGLGGPIDILVNNAGPYAATPFVDLDPADFERVIGTNVRAVYLMARSVAPGMRAQGRGRIINLSAVSGYVRNRSVYSLANASVITLTEELAVELAPEITVNAIAPGQIHESLEELRGIVPEWASHVVRATPMGRLVTRREIADIAVLMCGPTFDAVTGVTVPADGGLRINRFEETK